MKGYRELCCKTCENWKPENAKAVVEDHSRLNINGFQDDDDFDEDDEDISDLDYEELDLEAALNINGQNPILSQLDDDMANINVNSVDMEEFEKDFDKVINQHNQQRNQRSYINSNTLSDQYVQDSGSP